MRTRVIVAIVVLGICLTHLGAFGAEERIVFTRKIGDNWDVWIMKTDGTDQVQLSDGPGFNLSPMLSPDGKLIVYHAGPSGNYEIWVMDPNGNNKVQLTFMGTSCHYAVWSPDGSRIYFLVGTGLPFSLWVMDRDGSNQQLLASNVGSGRLGISPDGTMVAHLGMTSSNPNSYDVVVTFVDGSGQLNLSHLAGLTGYESPGGKRLWSRDGRLLMYVQEPYWNGSSDYDIWWLQEDGSAYGVVLDDHNGHNILPAWSRDEDKIVFASKRDGGSECDIWIMDADGTNPLQLTTDPGNESSPDWGVIHTEETFIRGDFSADGQLDLGDVCQTLRYLFAGAAEPVCWDAADSSDNGQVNLGDVVWTLRALFCSRFTLPEPYPNCGEDPTKDDDLDCESFPACP